MFKFVLLLNCIGILFATTAEYYNNLWDENVMQNRQWSRPTENAEFRNYTTTNCLKHRLKYDYVIVGGGSSGSVMATRLAENKRWKILLLDAGGDETDYSKMPGAFPQMLMSDINWGYLTTPQKNSCFGMINKQCDYTRGKVLGGGSSVNAMLHVRGNPLDFDNWEAMGNKGWSYKHVLPYFKKSENATAVDTDRDYRGFDGPLIISYRQPQPPILNNIIDANVELGYKHLDYNGRNQFGVSQMQQNTNFGRRYSTNQAYLKRFKHANLDIFTKAMVTKINFNKLKQAQSIEFLYQGKCHIMKAKKEFIISAGSINTPQLLMLSGIGPKNELDELGIPVIADLPVGKNLEDHLTVFNIPFDSNVTLNFDLKQAFADYVDGKGWLTYTSNLELRFQIVDNSTSNVPNIEIMFNILKNFNTGDLVKKQSNYNDEMDTFLETSSPISASYIILHPKSRGEITLKSKDPLHYPNINPNYFDDPDDIEKLYLAIKDSFNLFKTDPMKAIAANIAEIPIDACSDIDDDREMWYCIIRYVSYGIYHPVATCRMGTDKKNSVVNTHLKIHGLNRIRVVDASVIPTSTSGHLNSVAVMIAEKMSDEIKN